MMKKWAAEKKMEKKNIMFLATWRVKTWYILGPLRPRPDEENHVMLPQGVPLFTNLPESTESDYSPTTPSLQRSSQFKVFSHMFHMFCFHLSICFHMFHISFSHVFTSPAGLLVLFPNWGPETNCVPEMCSFVSKGPTATYLSRTNVLLHAPLMALRLPLWVFSPWFLRPDDPMEPPRCMDGRLKSLDDQSWIRLIYVDIWFTIYFEH